MNHYLALPRNAQAKVCSQRYAAVCCSCSVFDDAVAVAVPYALLPATRDDQNAEVPLQRFNQPRVT